MKSKASIGLMEVGQQWLEDSLLRCLEDPSGRVVFAYHGAMDHEQVQRLITEAENASLTNEDGVAQRKRMMNVLVEGLENVYHHSLPSHKEAAFALCVRDSRGYRLAFGNAVPLAMAALITHRVGILNEMDEADLKEHYLKLLSNSARSEHGGAGLGLLTMARKSTRPLAIRTAKLSQEAAFLTMEARVGV
jgi:hypothetical protein